MKIIATIALATVAAQMRTIVGPQSVVAAKPSKGGKGKGGKGRKVKSQGTRGDGVQWSAMRSNKKISYQEAGESFTARAGKVLNHGKGMHTLCYTNGRDQGQCKTEEIVYIAYKWDSAKNELTAAGLDALGEFTFNGGVQGDKTVITKTWISGIGGKMNLVGTVNLHALPDDSGLFYGDFDFITDKGVTGDGRFASAFTASAQSSFDDDSLAKKPTPPKKQARMFF